MRSVVGYTSQPYSGNMTLNLTLRSAKAKAVSLISQVLSNEFLSLASLLHIDGS